MTEMQLKLERIIIISPSTCKLRATL